MPLVRYSRNYNEDSFTLVDNIFINEYLPHANGDDVRVYLYGLHQCTKISPNENTIQDFENALNMSSDQIKQSFTYWNDKGIIDIVNKDPFEIKYLPIKPKGLSNKLYSEAKYTDFNSQLQDMFPIRMLSPAEYTEYYETMEIYRIKQEAMLMIAGYCIGYKGENVGYRYILKVAMNWANDNIRTVSSVEKKLQEIEANSQEMRDLFRALKLNKSPSIEDTNSYLKWQKSYGFEKEAILHVAKSLKNGSMLKLDRKLEEYFELTIFSTKAIDEYSNNCKIMKNIAIKVNEGLGVYYPTLDNIIKIYINPWLNMGYNQETLELIATICLRTNKRTLEDMNDYILKLYKKGVVTTQALNYYVSKLTETDKKIKKLFDEIGIIRKVKSYDRQYLETWITAWQIPEDMIFYSATLSAGKSFAYMNTILSDWHTKGINTIEKAKAETSKPKNKDVSKEFSNSSSIRTFDEVDLDSLYDDISGDI